MAAVIGWMSEFDISILVVISIHLSLADIIVFSVLKATSGPEYRMEFFNQFCVLLFTCSLTLMTEMVTEPEKQTYCGIYMCLLVLVMILVNLFFVVSETLKLIYRRVKK